MSNGSLAKRYARALFNIANDLDLVEDINGQLVELSATLTLNDGELLTALTTPVFKLDERKQVASVIADKLGVHQTVKNFLFLLLDKDRLELQSEIVSIFQTMADNKAGRVRASVQTATELTETEKADITKTLADSIHSSTDKLIVDFGIKPELIGGIWAKVGDRTYDATILSRLQDMRSTLLDK